MDVDETRVRVEEWHGNKFYIPTNSVIRRMEVPDAYQALRRLNFEQSRDILYHEFRREFFDAEKSIEKYPDPAEREKAMRTYWIVDFEDRWSLYVATQPAAREALQEINDTMNRVVAEYGDHAWEIFASTAEVIAVEKRRMARRPQEPEEPMRPEERIAGEIAQLQAATFEVRLGGVEVSAFWNDLSLSAQDDMLGAAVDWTGVSVEEKSTVITRALGLEEMERQAEEHFAMRAMEGRDVVEPPLAPRGREHAETMPAPPTAPDPEIDAIVAGLEAGWQADLARQSEALAIHRDVDASGLSAAERLVRDHEAAGGEALTYRYWVPESPDLAQGPASAIEFRATDADNAADRLIDFRLPEINGVLVDERGQAHQFDGESFQPIEGCELPAVSDYERLLAAAARRPANDNERGIDR